MRKLLVHSRYKNPSLRWNHKGLILLSALVSVLLINLHPVRAEKIYYRDGKVANAKIVYRNGRSIWVEYGSGTIGIDRQDIDRIENDDGYISKYDYESICSMIQNSIRQKKYDEAILLCSLLLESFPNHSQIRYLRASLNQKLGNFEKTIDDYNFLIEEKLADAGIFNNLGAIYATSKEYQKAREMFNKAVTENPDMPEAHDNLARLLIQTKDYSQAIGEYEKVIALESANLDALYNLGVAYLNKQEYLEAKNRWEKILTLNPEDRDAQNALKYLKLKHTGIAEVGKSAK